MQEHDPPPAERLTAALEQLSAALAARRPIGARRPIVGTPEQNEALERRGWISYTPDRDDFPVGTTDAEKCAIYRRAIGATPNAAQRRRYSQRAARFHRRAAKACVARRRRLPRTRQTRSGDLRRTGSGSRTSGTDPGAGDPDHEPPAAHPRGIFGALHDATPGMDAVTRAALFLSFPPAAQKAAWDELAEQTRRAA